MTVRAGAILFVALAALVAGPPCAMASSADTANAHAYLEANYRLMRYADAHIAQGEAAIAGVVRGVRRECPNAAAESPQDTDSEQLSNEVIGAIVTSVVKIGLGEARSFVRSVAPLHWSNRGLNRTIHSYAAKVKVLTTLAAPHVCADVKAWAASAFKTLPASTVAFDKKFMPAWVGAGELPDSLKPYEPASDRSLVRATVRLEERWEDFEAREVESWGAIMDTMVLQP
jgi:hypothetical protein